jgi:hypothetical protein
MLRVSQIVRLNPRGERVHLGAYVDPEQRQSLAELARQRDRSVSAELRLALSSHLERERQVDQPRDAA